jgi:hypothetical protein
VSAQQLESSVNFDNAVPMRLDETTPPSENEEAKKPKENDLLNGKGLFTTDTPK